MFPGTESSLRIIFTALKKRLYQCLPCEVTLVSVVNLGYMGCSKATYLLYAISSFWAIIFANARLEPFASLYACTASVSRDKTNLETMGFAFDIICKYSVTIQG